MNGRIVKEWLKEQGMRPEELATRLGVSMGTINRIFADYTPSRPIIIALAHVMGVEESDLLKKPKRVKEPTTA